jgi:DNA polymerase elongation subunit (family B)
MFHRAIETGCVEEFLQLSCTSDICGKFEHDTWKIEENTVFLASGEYNLSYIKMPGRLQIDLYTEFRRNYNLSSYTLNNVSAEFIGDDVSKIEHNENENQTYIYSKNLQGLEQFNYVMFEEVSHSSDYYKNGKKFKVMELCKNYFIVEGLIMPDLKKNIRWCLAKDDVDHHDIFNFYKGSDDDRAIIAKYCIQDCNLVQRLFQKIDLLTEVVEMANICSVPIDFIVMRGQGIKTASLIAKKCRENNILMPVLEKPDFDEGYEGAVVLPPKCGFYFEEPVYVNDYNSLYPSTIIAGNMSMESLQSVKLYDLQDNLIGEIGVKKNGVYIYDNLPGFTYEDVASDTYKYVRKTPKSAAVKVKSGYMVCRFAHFPNDKKAMIPYVLEQLLKARKDTKKLMEKEPDPFMKQIYNKRQNALKITANSIYGQCGAPTSMFYNKYVAASCTAGGRQLLIYAKTLIENVYDNRECETSFGKVMVKSEYVYGDTDSVFYKLQITKDGRKLYGKESLAIGMELAVESGDLATSMLRAPHKLAFEKAIWPFVLFKKKRYIGDYYEENTEDCYRKNMGNVLKRRDNAPLLKDVYGGTIDILMKEQDIPKSIEFVKNYMSKLMSGQISMDKLIITKSLRSGYKNPN